MRCKYLDHQVCIRTSGEFRLCCASTEPDNTMNIRTHTITEWLSSPTHTNAINQLNNGIFPDSCIKCKIQEQNNLPSMRTSSEVYGPGISHLDIRFSNSCNLACIMCSPYSSSTLMYESIKLGENSPWKHIKSIEYNWFETELLDKLPLDNIREIYLTGGEPMMVRGLHEFIKRLDSTVKLRFNTNGTIHNSKLINELKRFDYINMCYSIDGVGKVNDYIRYGSNFNNVMDNLKLSSDLGFDISVSPTIQLLNYLYMDEYYDYFNGYKIYENILINPSYLSITNRKHNIDRYKDYEQNYNTDLEQEFIKHVNTLDKSRNIKIQDYLPKLNEHYGFIS